MSELSLVGSQSTSRSCLYGSGGDGYVRLITTTEYFNLAPATRKSSGVTHGITSVYIGTTDKGNQGAIPNVEHITAISESDALQWLYSSEIGEWWSMGADADQSSPSTSQNAKYISSDGSFLGGSTSRNKAIRPVITVQK